MYKDFPNEAAGLKYFTTATLIAIVGLVAWIAVANPMNGDASGTTSVTVVHH
ncbi:MAG: hypothetical protein PHX82_07830 [Paracoccaceae bacterium]|jgi:hypothetical protein|nr:hypothetical protein [Paracoccaceae bacterium]